MGKSLPNSILNVLAQHVRIFDGNNDGPVNVARINGSFGLSVIDIGFSQLEAGDLFQVSEKFPNLSDGGNADLLIKVSSNVNVVCAFKVVGQARSELFLYEGTTVSTDGTELTPRSRNRQKASDASAAASFHSGPTVTDVGTELMASRGPGGAFGLFATGGESADIAQWVLKRDENYLFRLTNDSNGAADYSISIGFFETFVK
jgi:hypothetical protein